MSETPVIELLRKDATNVMVKKKPLGKFCVFDEVNGNYVAIDNSKGNTITEEFDTKAECLKWLEDGK